MAAEATLCTLESLDADTLRLAAHRADLHCPDSLPPSTASTSDAGG